MSVYNSVFIGGDFKSRFKEASSCLGNYQLKKKTCMPLQCSMEYDITSDFQGIHHDVVETIFNLFVQLSSAQNASACCVHISKLLCL